MNAHPVIEEIKQIFLQSKEILSLREVLHPKVEIFLEISSSRKYTRFEFPYCPILAIDICEALTKHNLEPRVYFGQGHVFKPEAEITIDRIDGEYVKLEYVK